MRHTLRPGLPELPTAMKRRPVDARGYPVPFFVAWPGGEPDHRIVEPLKLARCVREGLCWLCGEPLRSPGVCVVGPMCGVNHVSAEPPSHEACARFAVVGCPFLSRPHAHRREAGMPEGSVPAAGLMLEHNPGVSLLWWAQRVTAFKVSTTPASAPGLLFDIGEPLRVEWWAEGRPATRAEAEQAIAAGLPRLAAMAGDDHDRVALAHAVAELRAWLPP